MILLYLLLRVGKSLTKQQLLQFVCLEKYLWPGIVKSGLWTLDTVTVFCECCVLLLLPLAMPTFRTFVAFYVVACVQGLLILYLYSSIFMMVLSSPQPQLIQYSFVFTS